MRRAREESKNVEVVPIPLEGETIAQLAWIARETGRHPTEIASALLRDLLDDAQFWDAFGHGGTLN